MPIKKPLHVGEPVYFDASRKLAKIRDRFTTYQRMATRLLAKGISPAQVLRTQFPYALATAAAPPIVTIALTNICNLKCVYCTSPLGQLQRGFMEDCTFQNLLKHLKSCSIDRLRIVGNGEATLHPRFSEMIVALSQSVKYLSIVTNGQWSPRFREGTIAALMNCDLVEVSVESDDKDTYESSRIGGSFDLLLENLALLKKARDLKAASLQINVRLMMRPSERPQKARLLGFWAPYADSVMPQYIVQRTQLSAGADVYRPLHQATDSFPRCPLIFKDISIEWDGNVPLCCMSATQTESGGVFLGNINEDSLLGLWRHPVLESYRAGHRKRQTADIPICRGCTSA